MQVLVADDHPLFRTGLICLLAEHFPGWSFLQAASLAQAMRLLADAPVDLLVLDPAMPGMPALPPLCAAHPALKILVLTDRDAAAPGAHGWVRKTEPAEAVLAAIRAVLAGLVPAAQPRRAPSAAMAGLTTRQREVLSLLVDGRSTKDIARRLNLGLGTVKVHLNGVYQRLGARNRAEAVACFRQGLPS